MNYPTTNLFSVQRPCPGRPGLSRERHTIDYNDRVYARMTLAGRTIVEFTRDRITNFSALLAILRAKVPMYRGLAKLTVRNMTRGWHIERPIMLYLDPAMASQAALRTRMDVG